MVRAQHVRDDLVVTRRGCMRDRLHHEPLPSEPPGGAPMDHLRFAWFDQRQTRGRKLGEQRVHPEPLPALEAQHEQIRLLEVAQHGSASQTDRARHRTTQP